MKSFFQPIFALSLALLFSLSTLSYAQVDINSASIKEIAKAMKSVGKKKAKRIVEFRNEFGPFPTIDSLVEVKGISMRIVERNRDKIIAVVKQKRSKRNRKNSK